MKWTAFAAVLCVLYGSAVAAEEVPKSVFDGLELPVLKDVQAKALKGMDCGMSFHMGMNRCDDALAEFRMPEGAKLDWPAKRALFEACFDLPFARWRPCQLKEVGGIWSPDPATLIGASSFELPGEQRERESSVYIVLSHHQRGDAEWVRLWVVRMH